MTIQVADETDILVQREILDFQFQARTRRAFAGNDEQNIGNFFSDLVDDFDQKVNVLLMRNAPDK